jgi:HSP20 family protein
VDISETDNAVQITAELPGMEDKDISVSLDSSNNVLTISGEKKQEEEKKEAHCYRTERSYGSFYRSIPLPARVEGGKVNASFKKGVLSVVLPKLPEEKGGQKKISIRIE